MKRPVGKVKFSLAMIVRDESENLRRCLSSIREHVDECVVVLDSRTEDPATEEVAKEFDCVIDHYEWDDTGFAGARNRSFELCTGYAILWLDSDDEVVDGARLREIALKEIIEDDVGWVYLPYSYSQDEHGRTDVSQKRERILRNGIGKWEGIMHERHICDGAYKQTILEDDIIIHHEKKADKETRYGRVYDHLKAKCLDPDGEAGERDWFYYGMASKGLEYDEEADGVFREYFTRFGDDYFSPYAYIARVCWGELAMAECQYTRAMSIYMPLITVMRPMEALGWHRISCTLLAMENWHGAMVFAQQGLRSEKTLKGMAIAPLQYNLHPMKLLVVTQINLGRVEDARVTLKKGLELFPQEEFFHGQQGLLTDADHKQQVLEASNIIIKMHDSLGEPNRSEALVRNLPIEVKEADEFGRFTHRDPVDRDKTVCFLNNQPDSPLDPLGRRKGCTGAEITLVLQAEELSSRGYDVTVYSDLKESISRVNSVRYLPIRHFQAERKHGIVIGWRSPQLIDALKDTKYTIMSLHDCTDPISFRGDRNKIVDAVITQSHFHQDMYKDDLGDRCHLVPLGIIPEEYTWESPIRNPYACFYCSRPERGLLPLLQNWQKIKDAEPLATLHIVGLLDDLAKRWLNSNPAYARMIEEIDDLVTDNFNSGRGVHAYMNHIDQQSIHATMATMGVWLYPTEFDEVFCYTAVETQASGMYPVAINRAALSDTVHPDYQFDDPEQFVERALHFIGRDVPEERKALHEFGTSFSLKKSVDGLEAVFQAIRERRQKPIEVELAGV